MKTQHNSRKPYLGQRCLLAWHDCFIVLRSTKRSTHLFGISCACRRSSNRDIPSICTGEQGILRYPRHEGIVQQCTYLKGGCVCTLPVSSQVVTERQCSKLTCSVWLAVCCGVRWPMRSLHATQIMSMQAPLQTLNPQQDARRTTCVQLSYLEWLLKEAAGCEHFYRSTTGCGACIDLEAESVNSLHNKQKKLTIAEHNNIICFWFRHRSRVFIVLASPDTRRHAVLGRPGSLRSQGHYTQVEHHSTASFLFAPCACSRLYHHPSRPSTERGRRSAGGWRLSNGVHGFSWRRTLLFY